MRRTGSIEKMSSFLKSKVEGPHKPHLPVAERKNMPTRKEDYELLEEIGFGVSAKVYRALCKPLGEVVSIKVIDLENANVNLEEIMREAQTMKMAQHPNVLPLYCSFVAGDSLWMVTPFVSGGSCLNLMKWSHPDGMDEATIATIIREVLKALEYLHKNGSIHRDIKAGNILVDSNGNVLLADFGVVADNDRTGSWGATQNKRQTFVGTPCWMAPEVMEQVHGYDFHADIWSLGITILELAHGHAPFAKFPPMKVLLMTLQNPPPTLEEDSDKKHFSKAMREVVALCLQKEPHKRPTAQRLLEHKFIKGAKGPEHIIKHLLDGLPPLGERVKMLYHGQGPAQQAAQAADQQEVRSQSEYVRGVSQGWNFDVGELRKMADLEPDLPPIPQGQQAVSPAPAHLVAAGAGVGAAPVVASPQPRVASPPPAAATPGDVGEKPKSKAKTHGRFVVHEDSDPNTSPDITPPHRVPPPVHAPVPQVVPAVAAVAAAEGHPQPGIVKTGSKKKGRFSVTDEPPSDGQAPPRTPHAQAPPPAAAATPAAAPTGPAVADVVPVLQQLLVGMAQQQEIVMGLLGQTGGVPGGVAGGGSMSSLHIHGSMPSLARSDSMGGMGSMSVSNMSALMVGDLQATIKNLQDDNEQLEKRNSQLERQLNHLQSRLDEEEERRRQEIADAADQD